MIENMKKVSLLLHGKQSEQVLERLQALGLVHLELEADTVAEKHARLKALLARYLSVVTELEQLGAKAGEAGAPAPPLPRHLKSPVERLEYLEDRIFLRNNFASALRELEHTRKALLPWGDFSIARVDELRARGIHVSFFIGSERVFDAYDFGDSAVEEVARDGDRVFFLAFAYQREPRVLPFQEIEMPRSSLSEIENEIRVIRSHVDSDIDELLAFTGALPELRTEMARIATRMHYEEARHNLRGHKDDSIHSIVGWFPVSAQSKMLRFLEESNTAYEIEEPAAGDAVPIKLKNPVGAGLFEPITRIFALPNYFELDPTVFFAPFFTVFFGLCLGDVGYGLVVGLLAAVLYFVVPRQYRGIAILAGVLAVSTIVAGVLLNTFFGKALFAVPGEKNALFQSGSQYALFASYTVQGKTVFPAMTLALLLGFVQVFVGIALSGVNAWRQNGPVYVLKPIGMLLMLAGGAVMAVHGDFLRLGFNAQFTIGPIPVGPIVGAVPAGIGTWLGLGGLALFFFFCNPAVNFFVRPLLGLWDFYGFVTGLLGDFLSYIRLFALGLASGLLGNAFNHIAFMFLPRNADGIVYASPLIAISIVILVLGHTLNLGLSMLGSFVHPLRLTFVEFYKNIQFQGGGQEYAPFAVHKSAADS